MTKLEIFSLIVVFRSWQQPLLGFFTQCTSTTRSTCNIRIGYLSKESCVAGNHFNFFPANGKSAVNYFLEYRIMHLVFGIAQVKKQEEILDVL